MGIRTGNPTWQNFPSLATPVTAQSLKNIEDTLDDSFSKQETRDLVTQKLGEYVPEVTPDNVDDANDVLLDNPDSKTSTRIAVRVNQSVIEQLADPDGTALNTLRSEVTQRVIDETLDPDTYAGQLLDEKFDQRFADPANLELVAQTPTVQQALAAALPRQGAAIAVLDSINLGELGVQPSLPETDNTTLIQQAIATAAGRPVIGPAGRYAAAISVTDQHVNLVPQGVIVQQRGKNAVQITQPLGPALDFTHEELVFGPPNPSNNQTGTIIGTKVVVPSGYVGYRTGDIYHFTGKNPVPYGEQAYSAGEMVIPAEYATVLGVGIDVSSTVAGGPVEGNLVTWAGGAAVVQSQITMDATNSKLVVEGLTTALTPGTDLQVGGTTVGVVSAVYLIFKEVFEYNYTISQKMRKLDTSKNIKLDLTIDTGEDYNNPVGSADRKPAVHIMGGYMVDITLRVRGAWTRALVLEGVYGGSVRVIADGLPNHAITSEGAFGYGIELRGATAAVRVQATGRNLRHLITTNPTLVRSTGSLTYENQDPLKFGHQRDCLVYDSEALSCFSAGFDSHEGAIRMIFDNCLAVMPNSGSRYNSTSIGFQNRSFDTIFRNCVAVGGIYGFLEGGIGINRGGKTFKNTYMNCFALNYQGNGFREGLPSNPVAGGTFELINCVARGDGNPSTKAYQQYGYMIGRSTVSRARLINCISERFNYAPIGVTGAATVIDIFGFYADYSECDLNAVGMTSDSDSDINIWSYAFRGTSTSRPPAAFENVSGNAGWSVDPVGIASVNRTSNKLLRITAGSPALSFRRYLELDSYSSVGSNTLTLSSNSSKVQDLNGTLTADATVTFPAAAIDLRGKKFEIFHRGSGGNWIIGTTGKTLTPGSWCHVVCTGSQWRVTAAGTL